MVNKTEIDNMLEDFLNEDDTEREEISLENALSEVDRHFESEHKEEEKVEEIKLNKDDFVIYTGEKKGMIGVEGAYVNRWGEFLPVVCSGYYYDGNWLLRSKDSTISFPSDNFYVRKTV